jgi:DNA-binding response OmpR family regulator
MRLGVLPSLLRRRIIPQRERTTPVEGRQGLGHAAAGLVRPRESYGAYGENATYAAHAARGTQRPAGAAGAVSLSVLVVDDSPSVRQLLREYLEGQGIRVATAANGREGLVEARRQRPDVILLDLGMPEVDGYDFLRQYRRDGGAGAPVLIITSREEEADAVLGLELGADDYVVKPFRMRELVARIRAVVRRAGPQAGAEAPLRGGDIVLDPATYEVTVRGQQVSLTRIEFRLLRLLMSAPGRVFTREQLAASLEEDGFSGIERTLNVHVRNVRAKVEGDPANPEHVETVFGVGYRFRRGAG